MYTVHSHSKTILCILWSSILFTLATPIIHNKTRLSSNAGGFKPTIHQLYFSRHDRKILYQKTKTIRQSQFDFSCSFIVISLCWTRIEFYVTYLNLSDLQVMPDNIQVLRATHAHTFNDGVSVAKVHTSSFCTLPRKQNNTIIWQAYY